MYSAWYGIVRTVIKKLLGRGRRFSYGQYGEDAAVQAELKKTHGIYLDVGAYDPILYSNTYALYQKGWQGIVVDPNPNVALPFKVLRPRDTFVGCGIGMNEGELTYHRFADGAYNTFSDSEADSRRAEKRSDYLGTTQVKVSPLSVLLQEHNITAIDYLNVDVEGMDLEVLKSHNWSVRPRLITVEDLQFDPMHPEHSEVVRFLVSHGYLLSGYAGVTLAFVEEKNKIGGLTLGDDGWSF